MKPSQSSRPVRPPLIDPTSAYHNGLLDAVEDKQPLYHTLKAAGETVYAHAYLLGFTAGTSLIDGEENDC